MLAHVKMRIASGPQSGLAAVGVFVGLLIAWIGWHAAHSDYSYGYGVTPVADGSAPTATSSQQLPVLPKDLHLHAFGRNVLPLGIALALVCGALVLHGFRRSRPRYVLYLAGLIVAASLAGLWLALIHYHALSSVCACDGG